MAIHILPETVAAQIAAGEVVERPASVVKELVENALDAGATDIRVEVQEGGRRLIRVGDNGCGITASEVELAFARHATSKIQTIDDLNYIHTLGFRGEALHSIAAVSRVTLTTRQQNEPLGVQIHIEGGEVKSRRQLGTAAGTVVTVEDLFYNTPARLKFLKGATTERRHISAMVTNYALAYPAVRFSLHHEGREVFRTYGTGQLSDVLVKMLGAELFRDMIEITPQQPAHGDQPSIRVHGYTSAPHQNRANRSHITLFVNGRVIQDSSLAYAVTQAYHTLLPRGRYPIAILMITMPPEEVDVNVHPAKAEVRFRNPDAVFSAVQRAVRNAVVGQAPSPAVRLPDFGHSYTPGWQDRRERLLQAGTQHRPAPRLELEAAEERPFQGIRGELDDNALTAIPEGPGRPLKPRTLPVLRVLGQIGATYIVAEGPAGLYLIDQHAAHERILFEQLMAERAAQKPIAQQTLEASTIELPMSSAALLEENLETLVRLGFDIEPFGGQTFRIRAVPALLAGRNPAEALRTIIEDLELGADPGKAALEEQVSLHVCKAAAVKAGQVLSMAEMQALVQQLERCETPHTCPHGRPTLIHISADQLAREFGRT
ncbi:MAG: DNA mismatch repair endonuclease MutL [Anaerolineae bacterium]